MSEPIFFWSMKEFESFSNFFPSVFILDGKSWPTVEHYFQAMKTLDEDAQEAIRLAKTPSQSKRMGRLVELRSDWEDVKINVMLRALREKFSKDPLKSLLISTGDRQIYEDSPHDKIWGTGVLGKSGTGQNLLGISLMLVRGELS
jgi:ribA/ribD-fused uncharacterized protein